ncbi:MAG: hypothetical protein ACRC6E_15205 [Fusobacteriaceae bacterium]
MEKVVVIDSVMGSGKSEWAIKQIKESVNPVMYVAIYLDEVDRVINATKDSKIAVRQPKGVEETGETKEENIVALLKKKYSIATTHSLFSSLGDDAFKLIEKNGYTLILDEVIEAYKQYPMTSQDYKMLVDGDYIRVDEEDKIYRNKEVEYTHKERNRNGLFSEFFNCIDTNSVFEYGKSVPIIGFPTKLFTSFDSVFVLTYLFEGSILKAYFDINNIRLDVKTLPIFNEGLGCFEDIFRDKGCLFNNVTYDGSKFKDKIDICGLDKMNGGTWGHSEKLFSSAWYKNKNNIKHIKELENKVRGFFRTNCGAKSSEAMYTLLKEVNEKLNVKGYCKSFTTLNLRATNKYGDRKCGAYLANRYLNPIIKNFVRSKGGSVDEDMFALSELIQWVWRTRIRNGEDIKLYIPSIRMRSLIQDWLDGEINK